MDSEAVAPNTEAAILARMILADEDPISHEVALYLLSMRSPASDEERVNELSAKAQAGSLTDAETRELDSYLHIGYLLGVLQAKARGRLKQEPVTRRQ